MKPAIQTLGQILYSPSQYIIPVFQRNYRWDISQWTKLWESIREIQEPEKKGNHFMGFLVFIPELAQPGQYNRFHIIDGQQRITTLSMLLIAIRNIAIKNEVEELAEEIHTYYLIHPIKKGEDKFRLLPKEREHDNYIALIEAKERPDSRILQGTRFFETKVEEYCNTFYLLAKNAMHSDEPLEKTNTEIAERLRNLFDTVTQRMEFLCATLESEDPYNIFKSLNSTGVPLSQPDLVRNYVFMHVRPEESMEFDRKYWSKLEDEFTLSDGKLDEYRFSQFLRDYLICVRSTYHKPSDTFFVFEARYEATDFKPIELVESILRYSKYYSVISSLIEDESKKVTFWLKELNALASTTTYPIILSLFENRNNGIINSDELASGIQMLVGFILRRFICNESSRGYGQMFIRNLSINNTPIRDLQDFLVTKVWPSDERFTSSFIKTPLYTRGYAKHILSTLERLRKHKEPADLEPAQVEHIMPRTLSDSWRNNLGEDYSRIYNEWLNTPGNLTLSAYNQELWNHSFDIKKKRYQDSNIVLTRDLVNYEKWNETEIQLRGNILAKEAALFWIGPEQV